MSQYILDTDHISLILRNHPQIIANASRHPITVTIITVQELFNGWMGKINDPYNPLILTDSDSIESSTASNLLMTHSP